MRWTTKNIAKVSEALVLAGFPSIYGIVKESEVANMADIKAHIAAERTSRAAAKSLANAYGKAAIEYWESITEEELSERLACI